MKDSEQISLQLYNIVVGIRDTLSLPTSNTLEKTTLYSLTMLACSILSQLLGFYTFLCWQGCCLCTLCLIIFNIIERSEKSALLKMYSTARASAEAALRRAKKAGGRKRNSTNRADHKRSSDSSEG